MKEQGTWKELERVLAWKFHFHATYTVEIFISRLLITLTERERERERDEKIVVRLYASPNIPALKEFNYINYLVE